MARILIVDDEQGYRRQLQIALSGDGHEIHFPSHVTPIRISFETDWGPMALEVGLAAVPATAQV